MRRLGLYVLFLSACGGGSQRLTYDGAVKGNQVIGRYLGANPRDLFHTAEGGVAHFDGSAWTKVMGLQGPLGAVLSAGPGKLWILGNGKVERVDVAGAREDFTVQVSADGPPLSMGRGNDEVLICAGSVLNKRFFIYRFTGSAFERLAGPLPEPLTFELIRGRDDAFVSSPLPGVPFHPLGAPTGETSNFAYFDGTSVFGPLYATDNTEGVGLDFRTVSPRIPREQGVLGTFTFDGAWLHPSRRPPPTGFFFWRADQRLGVFSGLAGSSDWPTVYGSTYDPSTGQSGSTLLDINGNMDVHYWTAAWDGNAWVDRVKLFSSTACIGVTCGGSRTAVVGELDDGTIVTAGNEGEISGIWFVTP